MLCTTQVQYANLRSSCMQWTPGHTCVGGNISCMILVSLLHQAKELSTTHMLSICASHATTSIRAQCGTRASKPTCCKFLTQLVVSEQSIPTPLLHQNTTFHSSILCLQTLVSRIPLVSFHMSRRWTLTLRGEHQTHLSCQSKPRPGDQPP